MVIVRVFSNVSGGWGSIGSLSQRHQMNSETHSHLDYLHYLTSPINDSPEEIDKDHAVRL